MIHTVQMPPQDAKWLSEILDLQLTVLEIVSKYKEPISDDGHELCNELKTNPLYRKHAAEIIEWITRKKKLFEKLQQFAIYNDETSKSTLWEQIGNDVKLLFSPENKPLQSRFAKQSDEEDWKYTIGRFLYGWYDIWGRQGLDHYLFQTRPHEQGKYSRQDFIANFIRSNPHLLSCPICDAGAYRNETTKGVYTSIDHFFPRSQYPHLALHPYNLLPMCPACNSGEAGQRDPMAGIAAITDLLLPYHHRGIGERSYMKVDFRPKSDAGVVSNSGDSHALQISFQAAAGPNPITAESLEHFENIYGVEKRWNKERNLTLIDEHVFRRIRQFLLSDVQRGEIVSDPQFLQERLGLLMALVDQEGMGRDPFAFVSVWWLMWQVSRLENQQAIDVSADDCETLYKQLTSESAEPLLSELSYWACEQQKGFEQLRRRIVELQEKIPVATIE